MDSYCVQNLLKEANRVKNEISALSVDLEPELAKIINDNFWQLLEKESVIMEKKTALEHICEGYRGVIRDVGNEIKDLKNHPDFSLEEAFAGQHGEMIANIILAFRHLEDARMRLGKVMQQIQGGVSIFDRSPDETDKQ